MSDMGKTILTKVWSTIEKNRFTVIVPVLGFCIWVIAGIACTPIVESPLHKGVMVTAAELNRDYKVWQKEQAVILEKFDIAANDIELQVQQWNKLEAALMQLATGKVTDWGGLVTILTGSGLIGLFADNIRKNGVIGGLKRNNSVT